MHIQGQHINNLKLNKSNKRVAYIIAITTLILILGVTISLIGNHKVHASPCPAGQICAATFIPQDLIPGISKYDSGAKYPRYLQYQLSWASVVSEPWDDNPGPITSGSTQPVQLQLNGLVFIYCSLVVNAQCPFTGSPNIDNAPLDGTVNFAPYAPGSNSDNNNELISESNQLVSYTISGGGSITGLTDGVTSQTEASNNGTPGATTRYWFAQPVDFSYMPPAGGFTQTTTVTVNLMVKKINQFWQPHGDVYQCVGGTEATTTAGDYTPCSPISAPFQITFDVQSAAAWQLSTSITSNVPAGDIDAGQPLSINVNYSNSGNGASPIAQVQLGVTDPNNPLLSWSDIYSYISNPNPELYGFDGCGYPTYTAAIGQPYTDATPACQGAHWAWSPPPSGVIAGANPALYNAGTAAFNINPNTPDGTYLCFQAFAGPPSPTSYYGAYNPSTDTAASQQYCYTVTNPTYPAFTSSYSDAHSGSACPPNPSGAGILTDQPGKTFGGSVAQYIASALSSIGTGGTPQPEATLGYYGNICRPNLAIAAQNYQTAHGATSVAGSSINASSLSGNGTLYTHSGNITVTGGSVSARTTLYVQGDVTISNSISLGGSCTTTNNTHACPALGIIATGNIIIDPNVAEVDAFLSAGNPSVAEGVTNGSVYTCGTLQVATTRVSCDQSLVVKGFLQGTNIYFGRTCPSGTQPGGCVAETADMSGLLYTSTLPAFDTASAGETGPQYEGELPPLY